MVDRADFDIACIDAHIDGSIVIDILSVWQGVRSAFTHLSYL